MDTEMIERLVRVETKLDVVIEQQREHNKRHYDFSTRTLFAVLSSIVAVLISLFKN